jgi:hypothetical protein
VRHRRVDLGAAGPPPTRVSDEHHQFISGLVVLLDVDVEVLEGLEGVRPIALDGFPTAMDRRVRRLGRIVYLDVG